MIYKQIFIKSEADLPKEKGSYISCTIDSGYIRDRNFNNTASSNILWINGIKWYLKPCEIDMPSDEEIACEIIAEFLATPHPNQRNNYNREKKAFARGAKWAIEEIIKRNK